MAEPVQLFKTVCKLFEMVGIYPPQSNRSKPFNVQNLLVFTFSIAMGIASFTFLILKADNVPDFGASFYAAITEFSITLGFLTFVFKMPIIFEIINRIDRIMAKSK